MYRKLITGLFFALSAIAGLGSSPAFAAQILYGYDSGGQLVTINTSTAATTAVGVADGTKVGLARSSATGVAYTRSFDTLYRVDLSTGVTTTVGNSGLTGAYITGLTFNALGTMLYSVDQFTGAFYSVNAATGALTLIGNTGVVNLLDLTTSSTGVIYASRQQGGIYTINTSTGVASLNSSLAPEGLTAIEFDASGDLYGVGISTDALYRGVLTGPTSIGVTNPLFTDIRGLLFVDAATPGVPEPATWGLVVLGFGMVGGAMRRSSFMKLRSGPSSRWANIIDPDRARAAA